MGTKGLRRIQLGDESVEGTAVAASALWRGLGTLEDTQEVVFPDEDIGFVSGVDRTYIPQLSGNIQMESVPATFEQLPYILSGGVENIITGVADGAGTDFIYQYDYPTTALQTITTYTIEGGDDQEAEELNGAFVESFALTGIGGEALMMEALWQGRTITVAAFTSQPATPAVEDILFGNMKLYIDAIGGTIGTTQVSQTFLGMNYACVTGWKFKFSGDGALSPGIRYFDKSAFEIVVEITFEHDTTGVARKVDWRAQTPRLIRIENTGSAFGTAGTTYSNHTLLLDFAAKLENVTKIDEQDGNDILNVTFRARYNTTAAFFAQTIVVNEITALP